MNKMLPTKDLIEKYGQAVQYLPPRFRTSAMKLFDEEKIRAEEFRLRAGREATVVVSGKEKSFRSGQEVRHEELQTVVELATKSSVHTAQESIRRGFITVRGGHRIGICGTAIEEGNRICGLRDLSSIALRIAKTINNAAENIDEAIIAEGKIMSTLIISPPGGGKSTTLRDLVRRTSDKGYRISLVDERGELAAKHHGMPQFDVGRCTDIIDGVNKSDGAMLVLRAMTPDIIALDEITEERDIDAVSMISNCGVGIIATAHGDSVESLFKRPLYKKLYELGIFKLAVILEKKDGIFSHKIAKL